MTQLATDDFNRADNASLGANWATITSESAPEIHTNEARAFVAAGGSGSRYTAVSAPANQYSEVLIGSVVCSVTDEGVGPSCRVASGAMTHYFAQSNTVETKLFSVVAGAFNQLGIGASVATGDVIRLICNGTSISVTKNGTTIIGPVTDSAIASGNWGIWCSDAGGQGTINTWFGGDLASASTGATKSSGPGISPDYTQLFRSRQLGFTATSANVTVALTGSIATFTAGTLKANTDKAITGQAGTFAAGTLAPSTTVPLVGATATFTPGTFSASTGGDVTVALTGQTATFAAGMLSPAIDKGLTGSTATFAAGTLAPSTAVALTGSTATFAAGTFGAQVTGDVTVALTGITATFTAGTFTASGGDAPTSTFGDGVPRGGVPYKRAKTLKEKPNKHLKKILEDVESVYREIINGPDVPAAVAQIVAPFTESLKALPPAAEIDWDALEADAAKVSQLLRAWSEQQRKAQSDADDEWFLLSD